MSKIIPLTTFPALALALFAPIVPAHASSQEDVQSCREAMRDEGYVDMDEYRLRFERKAGFKARTVYLTAIHNRGEGTFAVSCDLDRDTVVAINQQDGQQYAAE